MQQIALTDEHKSKLLEMCHSLFPEKLFQDGNFFREGHIDIYNHGTKLCPTWPIYSKSIHWFEFCMTHLATSIYNKGDYYRNYVTITLFRGNIVQDATHPIDYLYEEFQKLKK